MPEDLGDMEMLFRTIDKLAELVSIPLRGKTTDEFVSDKLRRDLEVGAYITQLKAVADRIRRA